MLNCSVTLPQSFPLDWAKKGDQGRQPTSQSLSTRLGKMALIASQAEAPHLCTNSLLHWALVKYNLVTHTKKNPINAIT